jgi:hypothetical protein
MNEAMRRCKVVHSLVDLSESFSLLIYLLTWRAELYLSAEKRKTSKDGEKERESCLPLRGIT